MMYENCISQPFQLPRRNLQADDFCLMISGATPEKAFQKIKSLIRNHITLLRRTFGLKEAKSFTTFKLRKQLAECLISSKIDFKYHVNSPLTNGEVNKLQRLQKAAASFAFGIYVSTKVERYPKTEPRGGGGSSIVFFFFYNSTQYQ